jgi:hypothetical protein
MSIAADLAYALDPVMLAEVAGLDTDPWQRDVLRSPSSRALLNVHRQGGKSAITATLGIHDALYTPDSLVLLLSPSLRQSGELFRKVMRVYGAAGRPVPAEAETALQLTLANGSRVVALPGKEETIRGFSGVTRLIVDEASRVPDELYYAVRPMLAVSGGSLIAMSTPFGKRGWWHKEWTEGGEGWRRIEVHGDECPRISPEFLEEERRTLGPWFYAQEYEGAFMETPYQVFSFDDVQRALTGDVTPLFAPLIGS